FSHGLFRRYYTTKIHFCQNDSIFFSKQRTLFLTNAKGGNSMTRRGKIRAGTFALATVAVLGIGISVQNQQAMEAETTLSYVYQRAVSDLSGYVSGMEAALEKVRYANTATAQTSRAAQRLEESSGAKAALAALPASGENSNNINRFLSQAGDYASYLSRRLAAGSTLGEEEFNNLSSLRQYAQ